ncbi:MAG TPA: hypothetical protein DDW98_15765 [Gammaproteobacteria bacterium]|jgi:hypothetical protein|nr:hypothetical protein [Gammaproteobacteria bacterium]
MRYRKVIEVTCTGMVVAQVFSADGRRVGLELFAGILGNSPGAIERRFKRAHSWADKQISVCEKYERPACTTARATSTQGGER